MRLQEVEGKILHHGSEGNEGRGGTEWKTLHQGNEGNGASRKRREGFYTKPAKVAKGRTEARKRKSKIRIKIKRKAKSM